MQNARRAHKIRLCGHLRRYKKIVKKTYIIYCYMLYNDKFFSLIVNIFISRLYQRLTFVQNPYYEYKDFFKEKAF